PPLPRLHGGPGFRGQLDLLFFEDIAPFLVRAVEDQITLLREIKERGQKPRDFERLRQKEGDRLRFEIGRRRHDRWLPIGLPGSGLSTPNGPETHQGSEDAEERV